MENLAQLEIYLCCPHCRTGLRTRSAPPDFALPPNLSNERVALVLACEACGRQFPVLHDGIPLLWSDKLRESYEAEHHIASRETATEADVKRANVRVYDALIDKYERMQVHADRRTAARLRAAIDLAGEGVRGLHVDVGCGPGNMLDISDSKRFPVRIGCDISLVALRLAASKGHAVVFGDAERLPIANSQAGLITAYSVLHHLFEPKNLLCEARRVLKAGGALITDFDPNSTAGSLSMAARALYPVREFFARIAPSLVTTPFQGLQRDIAQAQEIAEFHNGPDQGFHPQELAKSIAEADLQSVTILLHNTLDTTLKNTWYSRPRAKRALVHLLSLRNPLARRNADSILTVSRRSVDTNRTVG